MFSLNESIRQYRIFEAHDSQDEPDIISRSTHTQYKKDAHVSFDDLQ